MHDKIRELFEKHTVPNFTVGNDLDLSKNSRGEYVNPTLEDHWQTFQEAAELIVKESVDICNKIYFNNFPDAEDFERSEEGDAIKKRFGV